MHCNHYSKKIMTEQEVTSILKNKGICPTRPRVAILKYVYEHFTHPTVDEVYTQLAPEISTLSKTTVYNTLRMYAEMGLCSMLTINERQLVFDGNYKPHAHFMCKTCGRVYDVPNADEIMQNFSIPGHQADEMHLYYKGTCQCCLLKQERI